MNEIDVKTLKIQMLCNLLYLIDDCNNDDDLEVYIKL